MKTTAQKNSGIFIVCRFSLRSYYDNKDTVTVKRIHKLGGLYNPTIRFHITERL